MLLVPSDVGQPAREIQCQTTTVDEICRDWPRVDLIKIDVEGAETLVWAGMRETRRRPELVTLMELHLYRPQDETVAFLREILSDGYTLRHIDGEGDIKPIQIGSILEDTDRHWMLWLQR